ncbi:L,D-transpeptidase family protein [Clostridium swellfunianum]|uniref:L,D-transpeptidase family protein n=1 Tax=Clostridium swellfunianum TaxID=1367462 RepID=UPI00202EC815|nr:peptidoglycan-binding protein [Clostridium swellfunianum]MCM0646951.1 L,D-transpeptidase family protein [Clostridium swellfunianum]
MNKKALAFVLPFLLAVSLTSCTKDTNLGLDQPNTPVIIPVTTEPAKDQVKPAPISESPKEEIKPTPPADQLPKEPTTFRQGDKGKKIKEIQQKLNKFGYKLIVDGDYGSSTTAAVIDFQKRNKINADGVVGPATFKALEKNPTAETTYIPPAPKPSSVTPPKTNGAASLEQYINNKNFPSKTKYLIWIDIPKQRVNIFTGSNKNWKLLKSMVCSTGKSYTPTIKGNFEVGVKGSYFIADGGARCKWYTQIKGNYLFHSVLYDNKGERIIDSTLGVPASHGCVRLATENAKFIYDNIPAGTAIWSN